jgi:phospholipid/cholesterol/gamma-HCH transport system substrate-binding protein
MEPRAHHLVVGIFVLAGIVFGAILAVFFARLQLDRQFDRYQIYFKDSVSGLSKASEVRYNGVPIGTVTDIRLDPADPQRVIVTIEVTGGTPIKEDSFAQLEAQGITGLAYVAIAGGSATSGRLRLQPGQKIPVIASRSSALQELFTGAPELLSKVMTLLNEAQGLITQENLKSVAGILSNVERATAAAAGRAEAVATEVEQASGEFRKAASGAAKMVESLSSQSSETLGVLRQTLGAATGVLETDLRKTLAEAEKTAAAIGKASQDIGAVAAENRGPLNDFSAEGLYEFARLITEARQLVSALSRLSEQMEADPARFLFGDKTKTQSQGGK